MSAEFYQPLAAGLVTLSLIALCVVGIVIHALAFLLAERARARDGTPRRGKLAPALLTAVSGPTAALAGGVLGILLLGEMQDGEAFVCEHPFLLLVGTVFIWLLVARTAHRRAQR